MLAATFAMTVARLNEWRIGFKPYAATQTTPANALAHSRLSTMSSQLSTGAKPKELLRNANVLRLGEEM